MLPTHSKELPGNHTIFIAIFLLQPLGSTHAHETIGKTNRKTHLTY